MTVEVFELRIRIRIKKNDFIDIALLALIYFQLVILEFLGYRLILNKIVVVLILFRLIFLAGRQSQVILARACGLMVLYILSSLLSDTFVFANVQSNFLMQFYPFVYAYYIYFICKNRPALIDSLLEKCFLLFNITMIINLIVMSIQIAIPYSINAVNLNDTKNKLVFYEDLISGLFAYSSTHVVCLFTIFITLYNLAYRKKIHNHILRNILTLYCVVLTAMAIIIALNNDNKALFLLFPLAILVYWLGDSSHVLRKKMNRIVLLLCIIPIMLCVCYMIIPAFREFLDKNVFSLFDIMYDAVSMGNSANGSKERISMIFDAITTPSTWFLGTGFGSNYLYKSGYLGYNHFGQADLGAFLFLGGIWYVILQFSCYLRMAMGIICGVNRKGNTILTICVFAILFCTMAYTQCFTQTNTVTSLLLIILALRMKYQSQLPMSRKIGLDISQPVRRRKKRFRKIKV